MTGSLTGPAEGHSDGQPITVLFFASAREAAGTRSALFGSAGRTLEQLTGELVTAYGVDLERVLSTCAIWVNGQRHRRAACSAPVTRSRCSHPYQAGPDNGSEIALSVAAQVL